MLRIKNINFISLVSMILLIGVFFICLLLNYSFLDSMGISGFVGMFVQMILSILQNILYYKPENVLFIAKNSSFSIRIMQGIVLASATKPGVKLSTHLVQNGIVSASEEINNVILENKKKYDSFIIRIDEDNEELHKLLDLLDKHNKKYVLVDKQVRDKNRESLGNNPSYVLSDFNEGGKLIGEKILEIYRECKDNINIMVCEVVKSSTSVERSSGLVTVLIENGIKYKKVELTSYDKSETFEKLLNLDLIKNCDVLVCANDDLAVEIMKEIRKNQAKYNYKEDIIFVGYDGIKYNNNYRLDDYGFKYITVDTCPEKQGAEALELVLDLKFNELFGRKELVKPKLYNNLD